MTSSRLRSSSALAVACALLAGCSLLPQTSEGSPRTGRFETRDLDGFFVLDDAPDAMALDLNYSKTGGKARINEVEGFWDESGSGTDCFDSFAASFLVSEDAADDEFVYVAVSDSKDPSSYVSIDGRVFADTASAARFFMVVSDAAEKCADAGGYTMYSGDEQVWGTRGVTVSDADELELPDGIRAIYQEEDVDGEFADGYRVYMLQRDNLVLGITVQVGLQGEFDVDDGVALVEAVAAAFGGLR